MHGSGSAVLQWWVSVAFRRSALLCSMSLLSGLLPCRESLLLLIWLPEWTPGMGSADNPTIAPAGVVVLVAVEAGTDNTAPTRSRSSCFDNERSLAWSPAATATWLWNRRCRQLVLARFGRTLVVVCICSCGGAVLGELAQEPDCAAVVSSAVSVWIALSSLH